MSKENREETPEGFNRNPYLFVVGCARSGTTLLQRMLNHHPQLAVANDTHFIPAALDHTGDGDDPPLTPDLVEWLLGDRTFARLGLPETTVREVAATTHTYREFVSALFSAFGKKHGKPLAGEKDARYVQSLPLLHALFPWAKILHIIRDGRDVTLSTLEWARDGKGPSRFGLWGEEPVAVCALWWRMHVNIGRQTGGEIGPAHYREVRYEDLVARTEETLQDLTGFLGLPFAPGMLSYYVGKTRNEPKLSSKKKWLPPTSGLRDWRTGMTKRDIALFEAIAGELLSALGYERTSDAISPEIATVAEKCEGWWDMEIARRKTKEGRRFLISSG